MVLSAVDLPGFCEHVMTKRNPEETNLRLLEAASTIIAERGVDALTLDAVAQAAGVSKGGLLHHFASKEALIARLIEYNFATFETDLAQSLDPGEPVGTPGRWTRAYVKVSFATAARASDIGVAFALMTRHRPDQVRTIAASSSRIWEELDHDGLDPVQSILIRSAADGVYYNEMTGNPPLPEPLRTRLYDALLDMTYVTTMITLEGTHP
jgi:AcrR family transcriptional regulator